MISNREKAKAKVEEIAQKQGAELMDFKVFSSRGKSVVRCTVDFPQGGITMGDCAQINREIFSYLDENNFLGDDFTVEVNSPGIGRPLKTGGDFLKVKGRTVSLWLNEPVEEKEYWEGEVLDVNDKALSLKSKDKDLNISFDKIKVGKEKVKIK